MHLVGFYYKNYTIKPVLQHMLCSCISTSAGLCCLVYFRLALSGEFKF
jgi:hypothetical protein